MTADRPPQIPPDRAERVTADSALVVAPHPDDELLGCGGLLLQLLERRAAVRVLYLTDGGGGEGDAEEDRVAYAARRRQEADAVGEHLGLAGSHHLGLPDGRLADRLDEVAAAVGRTLVAQRPRLLLVPSPLEASRDHRAAFAAVHRLLAPLRVGGGEAVGEAVEGLEVLVYEINRPAYPDLLLDVTAEEEGLAEAVALYASQRERRAYWRASLGLRRYRSLTLGNDAQGPRAAEGYRRLAVADFTTRSPAQLVAHLGGVAELHAVSEGPKVSVVVRTRDRPGLLAEALTSLAAGAYRRAEVVLVNDGGARPEVPADYPLPVVRVELAENRGRAAAADAGVAAAGGDAVAFLDDDDLAAPEHLATLAALLAAPGVRVAYTDAAVGVYELAGPSQAGPETAAGWSCRERRLPYSRDFDPDILLLDNYIPFNTVLVERALFAELADGEGRCFDPELPFFEDWDFLIRLAGLVPFHHLARVTCEYRHFRGGAHHVLGESPRGRADFLEMKARVFARHAGRLTPERLARAVDTLRAEAVESGEAAASARRDAVTARAEAAAATLDRVRLEERHRELGERYHALNGELAGLRCEAERQRSEVQRLYDDEAALRATVGEQGEHLGRTYAEIERLETRIREMEASRAWRVHLQMERLRGR